MLLASNYVRNHTKMYKKLKSCFEFTEGVPATVHGGKEEGTRSEQGENEERTRK